MHPQEEEVRPEMLLPTRLIFFCTNLGESTILPGYTEPYTNVLGERTLFRQSFYWPYG